MAATTQRMITAGISQRTINYINNVIDSELKQAVLADEAFEDTLNALAATDSVPKNAIEIATADQNAIAQIENGLGKTFVLRGDLNFGKTLSIPSDTTIYVDGTITMNGSHSADFYDDENNGNGVDAVLRVDDASNVKLIGVNNAQLVSNYRGTGVYIEGSKNIEVSGFDIGNVWEGVVAHWGNEDVKIFNNYIHDVGKRAIWSLGSDRTEVFHNFIENAGGDAIDFDAYVNNNVAYENVAVGWRRWAGFVEEGAQNSYFAKNLGIMAEFDYKHPDPNKVPDNTYTMGFADNGTSAKISRPTQENYFIGNTLFRPESYTRQRSGGGYFAKRNVGGKGQTYFWGNKGNVGYGSDSNNNTPDAQENSNDPWYKAELKPTVAPGQKMLDEFEARFSNLSSSPNEPTPQPGETIGEYGTFDLNHQWQTIDLNDSYDNPVVIVSDPTLNGLDPTAVRLRNVGADSFQVRLQEPNYKDGTYTDETVSYLVMEAGDWELADGTRISAGTQTAETLTSQGFDSVDITGFESAPTVLSQVQTFNGPDWVTTRTKGQSATGFQVAMQEEEARNNGGHVQETLGWLAVEDGTAFDGDTLMQGDTTGRSHDHNRSTVGFEADFDVAPSVIAKLGSFDGPDTANLRLDNFTSQSFGVGVHEEQSLDNEINYTTEAVSFLALEGPSGKLAGAAV